MTENITTSVYVVLRAKRSPWGTRDSEGLFPITAATVVGIRQGRPSNLRDDEVAVLLSLEVSPDLWLAPRTQVVVNPDDMPSVTLTPTERVVPAHEDEEEEHDGEDEPAQE